MKKTILFYLLIILSCSLSGQTQGINYQAIIADKTPQEIPGRDITGNIMPNHQLMVRFSILDAAGTIEYQEEHSTTTDNYGMINLVIGQGTTTSGSPGTFSDIDWNGTAKSLKVDLSLNTSEVFYTDFSLEELTFVPYAFHKNITATGSLIVDGMTNLKSRLDVSHGSPTFLSGRLKVTEQTTLDSTLTVNSVTSLNGQVTINPDFQSQGDKSDYSSYPLRVEGANQGIAIKIDGTRSSNNYFVTFWDEENIQGRIEGQTTTELLTDPEYIFDNVLFTNEIVRSTVDVAIAGSEVASASSSSTVCAGLGACVTAPIPSLIAGAIAKLALESANLALVVAEPVLYNVFKHESIGVSYQSGAADYAEWLPKSNPSEKFKAGDIVGVKNGFISKSTSGADHLMVISLNPIVLGNMPASGKEELNEKVAFMGQVPVKVLGKVKAGDFIIPSGSDNGAGIAVSQDKILPEQYARIVGIAWSESENEQYSYVNVAVGLNTTYMAAANVKQQELIKAQESEIKSLREQLASMNNALAKLVPGYADELKIPVTQTKSTASVITDNQAPRDERIMVYQEISKDQVLEGLELAKKILTEKGVDVANHPFFKKIESEPDYKDCFITDVITAVDKEMKKNADEAAKSGVTVIRIK
ncbi:MAG: hypothetical protein U0X39_12870 [Bacteroidales bacterium]